ncbi:MAG: hypothetical protein IJ849_00910 [Selenomonadaceae bacterium]|nr:hypothetical protein [Selenomonadaceae bacterium]
MSLKINGSNGRAEGLAYDYEKKEQDKDFQEMYAALVEKKRATLKETLEEMNARRQELKEIEQMSKFTEVVRRIMPDGSILVTEYRDGEMVDRYRKKPKLKEVPDENTPPPKAPDGTTLTAQQEMKQVPRLNIFDNML